MTLTTRGSGGTATTDARPLFSSLGPREARLQLEHSPLYPWIRPGEWHPAATLADRVLAGNLLRGARSAFFGRVLMEEHFEFRGGGERGGEREGSRPRRQER